MKISVLIKKACVVFSILIVLYSLSVIAFSNGSGMNPISVFSLFPFSFSIVLADSVLKYTKWKTGLKIICHFFIFTIALTFFVFLPHGKAFSPKSIMVLFAVYCFLYIAGVLAISLTKSANIRKKEKNAEYKNVY